MRAMILAAGRGERMRPLTDTTPKPLLKVHNKPLILWHIENLAKAGFREIVINVAYLGEQIISYLGDGSRWGVKIFYSNEAEESLETAGGIKKALPLLGEETFLVLNGDIFCNYPFNPNLQLKEGIKAHLILVPNPPQHPEGDFALQNNLIRNSAKEMFTFSGIGYYHPSLFHSLPIKKQPLAPLLREYINRNALSGEVFNKVWHDIGTPQRLEDINHV